APAFGRWLLRDLASGHVGFDTWPPGGDQIPTRGPELRMAFVRTHCAQDRLELTRSRPGQAEPLPGHVDKLVEADVGGCIRTMPALSARVDAGFPEDGQRILCRRPLRPRH